MDGRVAAIAGGQPVGAAVARTLGVPIADDDVNGAILEHLRTCRLLVILDNCEHVLDTVRPLVRLVLSSCPDVAVLVTTRERLAVRGEWVHTLAPLVLTDDSVDLFVERARDRGHLVDDGDRGVVTEICRRLDGMPLAIELAAARSTYSRPRMLPSSTVTSISST